MLLDLEVIISKIKENVTPENQRYKCNNYE